MFKRRLSLRRKKLFKVIKLPKCWGVYKRRIPPEDFLLALSHCDGLAFLFVVLPVEKPVLSVDLSVDKVIFNSVSEQKLFYNQPVEVRVGPRVLSSSKVKSLGGLIVSFKSSFSQIGSQFLHP